MQWLARPPVSLALRAMFKLLAEMVHLSSGVIYCTAVLLADNIQHG